VADLAVRGTERSLSFGPFRLLPTQRLLLEGEKPVRLGSRALDILIALTERASEVVGKDELMARVWPNTFVEEGNLKFQVGALRRTLDDGHGGTRYLATIPGRGYSFVAPLKLDQETSRPPPETASATHPHSDNITAPTDVFRPAAGGDTAANELSAVLPLPDKPSVAVLPFTNMIGDPDQEFFPDGIAEDVITALSHYPSLFVIARNSCFT
jgi:DNA-binding winged helix-turn-helix (wHTH) protein